MGYTMENGMREEKNLLEVKRFALTSADTEEEAVNLAIGYAWDRIARGASHSEAIEGMKDRFYYGGKGKNP
jgi:hypothetical protein